MSGTFNAPTTTMITIKSVQRGSITIAAALQTANVTITAVDPTKSFLSTSFQSLLTSASVVLTNATTVTANKTDTVYEVGVQWEVVEFY